MPALTRTEFAPWSPRFFSYRLCPHSRFTSAPKCPYVAAFVLAIPTWVCKSLHSNPYTKAIKFWILKMEGGVLKSFLMYHHPPNKTLEGSMRKENGHSFVLRKKKVTERRLQNCEGAGPWTGGASTNKKLFSVLSYVLCPNFLSVLKRCLSRSWEPRHPTCWIHPKKFRRLLFLMTSDFSDLVIV